VAVQSQEYTCPRERSGHLLRYLHVLRTKQLLEPAVSRIVWKSSNCSVQQQDFYIDRVTTATMSGSVTNVVRHLFPSLADPLDLTSRCQCDTADAASHDYRKAVLRKGTYGWRRERGRYRDACASNSELLRLTPRTWGGRSSSIVRYHEGIRLVERRHLHLSRPHSDDHRAAGLLRHNPHHPLP